eukprot:4965909-Pleurochrysis_carterae.AAC.1
MKASEKGIMRGTEDRSRQASWLDACPVRPQSRLEGRTVSRQVGRSVGRLAGPCAQVSFPDRRSLRPLRLVVHAGLVAVRPLALALRSKTRGL